MHRDRRTAATYDGLDTGRSPEGGRSQAGKGNLALSHNRTIRLEIQRDRFVDLLGWNRDTTIMNLSSGGVEASLSAVLAAIAHHFPESGRQGIASLSQRPAIYITAESHHSFVKIARMTGLGTDCLHEVPTTKEYIMDVEALLQHIERDRSQAWHPLMVVGTAGSTSAGLVDPLPEIAKIAGQSGIWFHVDAAWGGTALLSPKLRSLLAGIEQADSVTWDAHKWLSVPMGAGMFFCRHEMALARAFAVTASYLSERTGDEIFLDF